jgi:hypothetical protein
MAKPKIGKSGGRVSATGQGSMVRKGGDHKRPSGKKVGAGIPKGNTKGTKGA